MTQAPTPVLRTSKIRRAHLTAAHKIAIGEAFKELSNRLKDDSPLPLYRQVSDQIKEWIEGERLKPGWQLLSERTMSETLGISRRTVRAALEDLIHSHYVSATHGCGNFVLVPPRKREIRILALERFRKEYTFLTPRHHDLIHEAERRFNAEVHYKYVPDPENLREILKSPPSGYHGILLYRPPQEWIDQLMPKTLPPLEKLPLPLVVASRIMQGAPVHYVSPDHFGQTHLATNKLIQMGHRRIGYVSGMLSQDFMRLAYQGYQSALQESDQPRHEEDELFMEFPFERAEIEKRIRQFLADRRFSAVVVAGSVFSAPFEDAVQRAAIHIPGELSVILITEVDTLNHLALRWTAHLMPDEVIARSLEVLAAVTMDPSAPLVQELIPFREVAGASCQSV